MATAHWSYLDLQGEKAQVEYKHVTVESGGKSEWTGLKLQTAA